MSQIKSVDQRQSVTSGVRSGVRKKEKHTSEEYKKANPVEASPNPKTKTR